MVGNATACGVDSPFWDGLLEDVFSCPACGEFRFIEGHDNLQDVLEKLPGLWCMRRCAGCFSFYLARRPSLGAIDKSYKTYYTHEVTVDTDASSDGQSLPWRLANGYLNSHYGLNRSPVLDIGAYTIPFFFPLKQQLDFFMRHLPALPGRLLDVGCGNGQFLLRAAEAGWDALGLEPDPLAVCAAQRSGAHVVQGLLDSFVSDSTFDAITVSHVLEHVHNPQEFLCKIFDNMKPGAMVWLATPNVNSLGHWWFGSAWRGLEPPRHITIFSARALQLMLRGAGFVDIKFHRRGRGSAYILRESLEIARQLRRTKILRLPAFIVDIVASLSGRAAEELVVTAKRPAP